MSATPLVSNSPIHSGPRLTEKQLLELKTKIIGLRRLHDVSGFSTNKIIIDLLSRVSPVDLILLGLSFDDPAEVKV